MASSVAHEKEPSCTDGLTPRGCTEPSPGHDGEKPTRFYGYLLMFGHICSDLNQGALVAVLPFLVAAHGYSYAGVALLLLVSNLTSAFVQPLFGWLGDKKPRPWLMSVGVTLAGTGMAGIGLFDDFAAVAACAMVSGVGVAMFHPEGGRLANLTAGKNKGQGLSIFGVGGNIGFCVGPLLAAASLTAFGLAGTLVFLIPVVPFVVLELACNGKLAAFGLSDPNVVARAQGKEHWGLFSLVLAVLSVRSVVFYGVTAFVPLFVVAVFGQTEAVGSIMISVFSVFGAVGTLCSGKAADKTGSIMLAVLSLGATAVLVLAFSAGVSLAVSMVLVCAMAVCVTICNPAMVATGQDYVPRHLGMASGLSFGVAVSVGGVMSPILGLVGDAVGLQPLMVAVAACAALGCLCALVLKRRDARMRALAAD